MFGLRLFNKYPKLLIIVVFYSMIFKEKKIEGLYQQK